MSIKHVAITGGAGQIAYSLLFRIAAGEIFGPDQKVALHLLELPQAIDALKGTVLELDDCAFPLLDEVIVSSDAREAFDGVDLALLVGAKPRGKGMERKDLLQANAKIFVEQGRALNEAASPDVRVLLVGNPCNTNALIAMHNAPKIPREHFLAMTRLDENRAKAQLAAKAGVPVTDVTRMTIWGNHSATQVPDFANAHIGGKSATDVIADRAYLEGDFIKTVQQRGAEVIAARGKSSAASAANAALDAARALYQVTPANDWHSMAVLSDGNPYGIADGLIFSFPCRFDGKGNWTLVRDLPWDEFLKSRMMATEAELLEERKAVL